MVFEDAPIGSRDILDHIEAKISTSLKVRGDNRPFESIGDIKQIELKLQLYKDFISELNILDAKAGALANANAIIAGFIGLIGAQSESKIWPYILTAAFAAAVASLVLTISVLYVRWSTTEELRRRTLEGMVETVCRIRNARTIRFRAALYLLTFSLIVVSAYIVDERFVPGFVR